MVELSEFKQGMRCLASGVSLITTSNGDDRYGLWFCRLRLQRCSAQRGRRAASR